MEEGEVGGGRVGRGVMERGQLSGVCKDEEDLGLQKAGGRWSRQRRRAGNQGEQGPAGSCKESLSIRCRCQVLFPTQGYSRVENSVPALK